MRQRGRILSLRLNSVLLFFFLRQILQASSENYQEKKKKNGLESRLQFIVSLCADNPGEYELLLPMQPTAVARPVELLPSSAVRFQ